MKTIIVPTDFSDSSVNAAHYAAEMAQHIHAEIILLHMLPLPLTASEIPLPSDSYEMALDEANISLKRLKNQLEQYSNNKLIISFKTSTNSFMEEIESINRQKKDIFAMVMGTSSGGATQAFFLGSFSLSAARHLTYPVIVVPPDYRYKDIEKIGLACDMKEVSDSIPKDSIHTLLDNYKASLDVLYVSKPNEKHFPEVLSESKFLHIWLKQYHPNISITTNNDVKQGLEDFVQKNNIDLLLLLPKERSFIENLFHKSVTQKIVLHPAVPVMIVHR